ncbi:MAG: hypothetical protein FJ303_02040 [Planctomycetes bacterium]|nr:hypothetical protein [Planctomycetota bacterium]
MHPSAAAVMMILLGTVSADEVVVPLKQVPAPVLNAVKKRFPKAQIKQATRVVEAGVTTYEIELDRNGMYIEVALTPAGVITEIRREITEKDLPRAVTKTLATKYPKAEIDDICAIYVVEKGVERLLQYEVDLVTADNRELELVVSPAGEVLEETQTNKK